LTHINLADGLCDHTALMVGSGLLIMERLEHVDLAVLHLIIRVSVFSLL